MYFMVAEPWDQWRVRSFLNCGFNIFRLTDLSRLEVDAAKSLPWKDSGVVDLEDYARSLTCGANVFVFD